MRHVLCPPPPARCSLVFLISRPPPRSTLFPYTTLFRSHGFDRMGLISYPASAGDAEKVFEAALDDLLDRKSTRLNSSHRCISYAVFCLKKKKVTGAGERPHSRLLNTIANPVARVQRARE